MVRISDVRLQHYPPRYSFGLIWQTPLLLASFSYGHAGARARAEYTGSLSNLFSQSVVTYSSGIENFSILAHGWHAGAPAALLVTAKVLIVAFVAS